MRAVLRVTCTTALALACLDGHAKTVDRCITTLEARPVRNETTVPAPRPCPTAVGYVPQRSSGARQGGLRVGSSDGPASAALHV